MWLPLEQGLNGSIFRGNKAFEGLSQKKINPIPTTSKCLPPFCVPTGFYVLRGDNFFRRAAHGRGAAIFAYIFIIPFFQPICQWASCTIFFPELCATCLLLFLLACGILLSQSRREVNQKPRKKIFQKSLKNPLTKSKRCDIISTPNKGKR